MNQAMRARRPVLRPLAAAVMLVACCQQAYAQTAATPAASSGDVTQNLIRILVMRGTLSKEEGEALLAQAQAAAAPQASGGAATVAAAGAAGAAAGGVAQPGDVRVPYVSPRVRAQIKDEVKQEVIAQAKEERWAEPNTFPDWVSRITVSGDVRLRYQGNFYNDRNAPAVDYAAINQSGPVDMSNPVAVPFLNTNADRGAQMRIRARLGVTAAISDDLTAGIRLATGSTNGPVSTTQTLGGGLAKKNVWLDQAYLDYRFNDEFRVTAGRFGNPFYGLDNADLVFSNDLQFDGIAGRWLKPLNNRATAFATAGVFPVNYGDDNFPGNSAEKFGSRTNWLFGVQAGGELKLSNRDLVKGAIAYYQFTDMRGALSSPCLTSAPTCDTDRTRQPFMQKGNTVFALRNNVPVSADDESNPQFFGLTQQFRPLNITAQWDTHLTAGLPFSLQASYVRNLAYSKDRAFQDPRSFPANHYEGVDPNTPLSEYKQKWRSGPNGVVLRAIFGNQVVSARGQWNFLLGYKYLQPDAVPDGFTDPDFRLGGTNAKGYFLGAAYGIDKNAWLQARWLSGREVYGDPLAINVLMLEINAKF